MRVPQLTWQLQDGVMWSAVHSSYGVPGAVIPQTLEDPGHRDDRRCPAGCPPFIGHRGANSGAQASHAAEEGQNL